MDERKGCLRAAGALYQDPVIGRRSFSPRFRAGWEELLGTAAEREETYFDPDSAAALSVPWEYGGVEIVFHFDQSKMADWYFQEVRRGKRVVFVPQRLRRSRSGELSFHSSPCFYDPALTEPALAEADRNILAAAMPGLPPPLRIVYGNKWVERKFNPLAQRHLSLFLIQTDYVPAFLASPFEICVYLFLMDCCILRENREKVRDEDLQNFLHIFRPSPVLKIKGLL